MPNTEWLPGEPPASTSGNYLRLKDLKEYKDGTVRFRVLDFFTSGFEVWDKDNKPHRADAPEGLPPAEQWRVENGKRQEPRRFWVAPVWNVQKERVQLFQFVQATIYRQLKELVENEDWGRLDEYDLTLKRTGEGTETKYIVLPCPKKPMSARCNEEWNALKDSWTGVAALFTGGDPFSPFGE